MGGSIRALFGKIRKMGKGVSCTEMATYTSATSPKIRNMAKAHFTGSVSAHRHAPKKQPPESSNTTETGGAVSPTARANTKKQTVCLPLFI